jgi:tetratricopeptide (TPR) repeat protein
VRLRRVNYLDWAGVVDVASGETVHRKVELRSRTEAAYLATIADDPKDISAWCDLGHYYILQSAWEKAEEAFASALTVSAREPSAAYYSGRLKQEIDKVWSMQFEYSDLERGRRTIARAFIRAIDKYPGYQRHYSDAIRYATAIAMDAEAQEVVERGIQAFPHSTNWVIDALGQSRRRNDDTERLLRVIGAKIKRNPKDFVSRYQHVVLLKKEGETDEVIKEYEALLPLARSAAVRARLLADLGRMYERKRDYAQAAVTYRRAVEAERDPKDRAPLWYNLARVYTKLERHDEVVGAWENAVAAQDDVETACRWRLDWAQACLKAGKRDRARRILEDARKLARSDDVRERATTLLGNLNKGD